MSALKPAAQRAGALYLLVLILGMAGIFGGRGFHVPGDAAATARNVIAGESAYRVVILNDAVTFILFLFLAASLYNLFKGVDRWHAVVMVILVSVGVAIGFVNLLNRMAPLILLKAGPLSSLFSKPQLEALSLAFLSLNNEGNNIDGIFWGLWLLPFGTLVIRSGFFPRILGIFLWVAGLAYLISSLIAIGFPAYSDGVSRVLMPLLFAEFPIIFWLLIKGARSPQPLQS